MLEIMNIATGGKSSNIVAGGDVPMKDGLWDVTGTGLGTFNNGATPTKTIKAGRECLVYHPDTWLALTGFDPAVGGSFSGMFFVPSAAASQRRYFMGSAYAMRQYCFWAKNLEEKMYFYSSDYSVNKPMCSYPQDEWFHAVFCYKDKTYKVYINGVFGAEHTHPMSNDRFYPIASYEGEVFAYNQRVYKRCVTDAEAADIYASDFK